MEDSTGEAREKTSDKKAVELYNTRSTTGPQRAVKDRGRAPLAVRERARRTGENFEIQSL